MAIYPVCINKNEFFTLQSNRANMSISELRQNIKNKIEKLEEGKPEAKDAALDIIELFKKNRVVCACAETQMGKTTICRLIAKNIILSLSDNELALPDHKVVVYIENVANNDLKDQAFDNFSHLPFNVDVMSVTRASSQIEHLPTSHGIIFIIDESHMGCDHLAKRLNEILGKIESRKVDDDRILLVSATGFSSIYEASKKQNILGYEAAIRVVQPPKAYRGISQFLNDDQIIDNSGESCFYEAEINTPAVFNKFVDTLSSRSGGVYIIRSSANNTQSTKERLLELCDSNGNQILQEENIKIVARSLKDVDKEDLESWDNVLRLYPAYKERHMKLVIIVRGFLRVGIAMPQEMKEDLVATWDGTSSAVSSVVQALVGRACGYHKNDTALHFANKNMLMAHSELNECLATLAEPSQIEDIAKTIQNITQSYGIPNWDPGLAGTDRRKKISRLENKVAEPQYQTKSWASYSFDPNTKFKANDVEIEKISAKLDNLKDISDDVRNILAAVHSNYLPNNKGRIPVKSQRKLSPEIVSGQFINKKTFTNPKHGQRSKLTNALNGLINNQPVNFNNLRTQGRGFKQIDKVGFVAYVLSTYNKSSGKVNTEDSLLSLDLLKPFCNTYGIELNNTIVILFAKGESDSARTREIQKQLKLQKQKDIEDGSVVRTAVYAMGSLSTE